MTFVNFPIKLFSCYLEVDALVILWFLYNNEYSTTDDDDDDDDDNDDLYFSYRITVPMESKHNGWQGGVRGPRWVKYKNIEPKNKSITCQFKLIKTWDIERWVTVLFSLLRKQNPSDPTNELRNCAYKIGFRIAAV
jgi:hypothetical protein